ncbi:MAG: ATP-binding protein [Lachnospiraceae bacterium]|nr:ATP-binding protein [Lachnospiraceae bacterium]
MERVLYHKLCSWKDAANRKPLLLDGARQVGKTWLLQFFGRHAFENTVYLNCDGDDQIRNIFAGNYDIGRILTEIGAVTNSRIVEGKTLLILDEIQEVPRALTALKYFQEQRPALHVAAAGSLLGIAIHENVSFPVGKTDLMRLYPLSFPEFVHAVAGEKLYDILASGSPKEQEPLREKLNELLRQYYFTGGMPEAVSAFTEKAHPQEIRTIQNAILYAYEKDISKHVPSQEAERVHRVWNSIPSQLAKENKKFIFGALRKGARAAVYESAIGWLRDAGLVYRIPRVRKAQLPLKFYEDEAFKLFMLDCGLMGALSETPSKNMLIGVSVFEEYRGAFTEQYVLQQLISAGGWHIYYYSAENGKQELDFLLQREDIVIPVEVKAAENLRAKSLRFFVADHPRQKGIRLSLSGYREQDWMINLPLYDAWRSDLYAGPG